MKEATLSIGAGSEFYVAKILPSNDESFRLYNHRNPEKFLMVKRSDIEPLLRLLYNAEKHFKTYEDYID